MPTTDDLLNLMEARGHAAYFGESVSILEHSLQCAHFAEEAGAGQALVTAALLHDVGHLLHDLPETIAREGQDTRHEELAARYLETCFGEAVVEPVRMHVAAKRYLCATDPKYLSLLSPSSVESLALQGGPMSDFEAREYEARPYAREAALLRRWDDEAKIVGLPVAGLAHYRKTLEAAQHIAPPALR